MKKSLAHLCAALILTTSFPALASDIPKPDKKPHFKTAAADTLPQSTPVNREVEMPIDFTISKIGDTELSCGALSTEAQNMRDIIYIMEDEKTSSKLKSHGVTAAGAVGSLLIGTATGGVGLALGGFLLDQGGGHYRHARSPQSRPCVRQQPSLRRPHWYCDQQRWCSVQVRTKHRQPC